MKSRIWGHMTEAVFYSGVELHSLTESIKQWPYFVLLGLGITAIEFWLLHKKKTRDDKGENESFKDF